MKVWVAVAETEANDQYVFVFEYEPTVNEVLILIQTFEKSEDLAWYQATTDVIITKKNVRQRIQKPPETATSA